MISVCHCTFSIRAALCRWAAAISKYIIHVSSTVTHWINVVYHTVQSHPLPQSITMHSRSVNTVHTLYITSLSRIVHTSTNSLYHTFAHAQRSSSPLFESAGVVIIQEGDGDEQSVASSLITLDADPLISSTGTEESSAAGPYCLSKFPSFLPHSPSFSLPPTTSFSPWCYVCSLCYFSLSLSSEPLTILISLWLSDCLSVFLSISLFPFLSGLAPFLSCRSACLPGCLSTCLQNHNGASFPAGPLN